jgi:hypothetical protein
VYGGGLLPDPKRASIFCYFLFLTFFNQLKETDH